MKSLLLSLAFLCSTASFAQVSNDTIPDDSIDYAKYLQEVRVYGVSAKKKKSLEALNKERFAADAKLQQNVPEGFNVLGIPFFLLDKLGLKSKKMSHKQKVKQILDNY